MVPHWTRGDLEQATVTSKSPAIALKVTAGPVKGERVLSNNTATYKLLLQLK